MEFDYDNPGRSILEFEEKVKEHLDEYKRKDYIVYVCLLALSDSSPEEAAEKIQSE